VQTLQVDVGHSCYPIAIGPGLLADRELLDAHIRGRDLLIVTNTTVARLYLWKLTDSLAGRRVAECILPDGEQHKTLQTAGWVFDALVGKKMNRDATVLALGGGVVGDIAGFAAACYQRGIGYVQIPTTLLAQVDSSVGGKTGVNHSGGKNLIGAFYQPILVLADTALLDTLPEREFRAGYAEVAKYGLLGDAPFFAWLENNWREVFGGGPAREHAIAVCCRAKADIVARDERETGDRALLNLGHTFGHAFEAACGFSGRLLHGEAVAIGMALAFAFSAKQGLVSATEAERATRHLAAVGLPTRPQDIPGPLPSIDRLMELIAQDKKVKRGMLTFILAKGIGAAFVEGGVDAGAVRAFLGEKLAER